MQVPKATTAHKAHDVEPIINDEKTRAAKQTIMHKFRANTILESVGTVAALAAGPLIGYGLVKAAEFVIGGGVSGAAAGTGAAAATAMTLPAVLTVLAVGATIASVAVAANYIARRKAQSVIFDNQEAISQSNARNLVKELEAHNLCLTNKDTVVTEPTYNQRSDGKTWTQAVKEQQQQQAAR